MTLPALWFSDYHREPIFHFQWQSFTKRFLKGNEITWPLSNSSLRPFIVNPIPRFSQFLQYSKCLLILEWSTPSLQLFPILVDYSHQPKLLTNHQHKYFFVYHCVVYRQIQLSGISQTIQIVMICLNRIHQSSSLLLRSSCPIRKIDSICALMTCVSHLQERFDIFPIKL